MSIPPRAPSAIAFALAALTLSTAATAQEGIDANADAKPPHRYRAMLGPQIAPRYPGADSGNIFPVINLDRTRRPMFDFEAPDESGGFGILNTGGLSIGPAFNFQGSRRARDTDDRLPRVKFTVELGGFAEYLVTPAIRLRGEARKGLNGHKGWIGLLSADYIARDADHWLVSIGPRLTLSDRRYNRAYFGVADDRAATAGLPAFDPAGGAQAVGAAASVLKQISGRWGLYGFAKYDRLVDDAGRSPVVRTFGSRNQLSAGAALTYTFGRGVR